MKIKTIISVLSLCLIHFANGQNENAHLSNPVLPQSLSFSNITSCTCSGSCDGSVKVSWTGTGVGGPFSIQFITGTAVTFNSISASPYTCTGLCANTYTVKVFDSAGNLIPGATNNLVIGQPAPLSVSIDSSSNTTCGLTNGWICSSAIGGTPPYTYDWGVGMPNAPCIDSLSQGVYLIIITDVNGCNNTNAISIQGSSPINVSANTGNYGWASCGQCNGYAYASISGGNGGISYVWAGPIGYSAGTPVLTNICGGTYTCTVYDTTGCTATDSTTIIQYTAITAAYFSVIPSACGQSNGSVILDSVVGGKPPYGYIINGNVKPLGYPIDNLLAGNYNVYVGDSIGCSLNVLVIVNDSNFTVAVNPYFPTCNQCDGSLSSSITGGAAPYTYLWNNSAATDSIGGLCSGHYQLNVTDAFGCFSSSVIDLYPLNSPVINTDTIVNASCYPNANASAAVSVVGGTPPYAFLWNTIPAQTTSTATGLQGGQYIVTVTDALGCSSTSTVNIMNLSNIFVYSTQLNPTNCQSNGSISVSTYGLSQVYSYSWSNGASGPAITNLAAGIYSVTSTGANGCITAGTFTVQNQCYNRIEGRVYNDANQNCIQDIGENGLPNMVVSAANYYGYSDWNGDYIILTPNMNNSVAISSLSQPYYSAVCPVSGFLSVNFSTLGDTISGNDFAYYANSNYVDLSIHPGWTGSYPGYGKMYWIYFSNLSPSSQNVTLNFDYDSRLNFDSCSLGGVHNSLLHRITWNFNNVPSGNYFSNFKPFAYFHVPLSVPITDSIISHFEILPITGDAYPANNTLDIIEPVTGSRDPNEKSVIPKGEGPNGNILQSDSTLLYTVHFQNNGNDTALTVVVVDTLSQFLDPSTIVPGASSHPYTFDLSGQGIMTFTFSQILLPDSLTNEPASNGYFNYTIKQKANNPYGSVINNTAYIYFDFNSAVVTNTTVNTIVAPVGIIKYSDAGKNMLLYPNPTANSFMLQYEAKEEGTLKLEIYNLMGELIRSQQLSSKQKGKNLERIDVNGLSIGIYLVKLSGKEQQQVQKLIIEK
ncbi:MAG: T9SS type A sorting domain-containing protein [Bacteroidia bacterium]